MNFKRKAASICAHEGPSQAKRKQQAIDLTELFKCPVCFEYVLSDIQQCRNGHIVCATCKVDLETCPICRVTLSDNIRNLLIEKVGETLAFPCKYTMYGCSARMKLPERTTHEALCPFQTYRCPYWQLGGVPCWWSGSLEKMQLHLQEEHQVERSRTVKKAGSHVCTIKVPKNGGNLIHHVRTVTVKDHTFLVTIANPEDVLVNHRLCAFVQYFGLAQDATRFRCSLTAKSKQKMLPFKSSPRSIKDDVKDLTADQHCWTIDTEAVSLVPERGNLVFYLSITDDFPA